MKIGILETGEVHPDLRERHGDYPAMFERLLGAADPALDFFTVRVVAGEMPASPRRRRRLARHRLAARGLRRPAVDRPAQGIPARLRRGACPGGRHLLRPPDPRRGAGWPRREVGQGWGLGVQDYELVAKPGWMAGAARPLRRQRAAPGPGGGAAARSDRARPLAALRLCGDRLRRPRGARGDQPAAAPEFGAEFMDELLALRAGTVFPVEPRPRGARLLARRSKRRLGAADRGLSAAASRAGPRRA